MSHVSHLVGSLLLLASWATIYLIHSAGFFSALNFLKLDNSQRSSYTSLDSPVDGLWNPLNLAAGNNPDALINGTGVHGFIFNASDAPAGNTYYGGYNYCNMPHVNRRNYIQVLENHILTYVEVVCLFRSDCITDIRASPLAAVNRFDVWLMFLRSRFTGITNVPRTQPTPFHKNKTPGIAATQDSSPTANPSTQMVIAQLRLTGPSTQVLPTLSRPKASMEPANFRRSQEEVSTTAGSTVKTSSKYITIYSASFPTNQALRSSTESPTTQ